jgi:hypothetical protein
MVYGNRLDFYFAVNFRCWESAMTHLILGTGATGAMALSTALFGTGVAAAGDYDGQTYADAVAAIEETGGTPVIASVASCRRMNASS